MDRAHYVIFAALLLTGCDSPNLWRESEIRKIAAEEATEATTDLDTGSYGPDYSEEIEALSSRIDDLETENAELQYETARLRQEDDQLRSEIEALQIR